MIDYPKTERVGSKVLQFPDGDGQLLDA